MIWSEATANGFIHIRKGVIQGSVTLYICMNVDKCVTTRDEETIY